MTDAGGHSTQKAPARHRWLLGLEPIFEGGWFHKGARARSWNAEEYLTAIALFGDVIVDLAAAQKLPAHVEVHAYALLRDIEVLVPRGTTVEVTGGSVDNHVKSEAPDIPVDRQTAVLRVISHAFRGDITLRLAGPGTSSSSPLNGR
jgi:hypothetical protein